MGEGGERRLVVGGRGHGRRRRPGHGRVVAVSWPPPSGASRAWVKPVAAVTAPSRASRGCRCRGRGPQSREASGWAGRRLLTNGSECSGAGRGAAGQATALAAAPGPGSSAPLRKSVCRASSLAAEACLLARSQRRPSPCDASTDPRSLAPTRTRPPRAPRRRRPRSGLDAASGGPWTRTRTRTQPRPQPSPVCLGAAGAPGLDGARSARWARHPPAFRRARPGPRGDGGALQRRGQGSGSIRRRHGDGLRGHASPRRPRPRPHGRAGRHWAGAPRWRARRRGGFSLRRSVWRLPRWP